MGHRLDSARGVYPRVDRHWNPKRKFSSSLAELYLRHFKYFHYFVHYLINVHAGVCVCFRAYVKHLVFTCVSV